MIYKQMVEDNTVRELQAARGLWEVMSTFFLQKIYHGGGDGKGDRTQWVWFCLHCEADTLKKPPKTVISTYCHSSKYIMKPRKFKASLGVQTWFQVHFCISR